MVETHAAVERCFFPDIVVCATYGGETIMRAILFILILVVVAALIAIGTGFLDIRQTRPAQAPRVNAGQSGITAKGGQTPAFDVETGSVSVGTKSTNVIVPTVKVNSPDQQSNTVANTAG
jgi:hypothetical protein